MIENGKNYYIDGQLESDYNFLNEIDFKFLIKSTTSLTDVNASLFKLPVPLENSCSKISGKSVTR